MVLGLNDNQFLATPTKLCEQLHVSKQSQDIVQATYSNQLHSTYPLLPCPFKASRKPTLGWFLAAEEFLPMPGLKPDQILSNLLQSSHLEPGVGRSGCLSYLIFGVFFQVISWARELLVLFYSQGNISLGVKPRQQGCFASWGLPGKVSPGLLLEASLGVWGGYGDDKVLKASWIPRKQGIAARSSSSPSGLGTTTMSWVCYCLWENPWSSIPGSKENTEGMKD